MNFLKYGRLVALTAAVFAAPAAFGAAVDGEPRINEWQDTGLYVWRTDSGRWQTRLVGGGANRSFNGDFDSDKSISSFNAVATEWGDSASKSAWNSVKVDFSVSSNDVDGAAFDTAANSTLCLRRVNGLQGVYLGQNKSWASFPVALDGSGACGGGGSGGGGGGGSGGNGLYVYQANGVWNADLVANSGSAEFSGDFESQWNINSLSRENFESSDSAWLVDSKTVRTSMSAWSGGSDGINISIPKGSGMCLRSNTGSQQTVYLGRPGNNPGSTQTPVDLTGDGACGGSSGGSGGGWDGGGSGGDGGGSWSGGRKLNGGHYVALMRGNDSQKTMSGTPTAGAKGFLKRYTWRELEPSQGNYNFSEIASDLNYVASQGMQLVVMIEDKTFKNENPMPNYLSHLNERNRKGGWTPARWTNTYVNAKKRLLTALGNRFDGNPAFEGWSTQESAPGLDGHLLNKHNYTPEKYRDALIEVLRHGAQKMPKSRTFWFMNFFPRNQDYIRAVANAVKGYGVIMGNPDIMPDDTPIQTRVYPYMREQKGKMPLFSQVEPICYHHEHEGPSSTKYWTPAQQFRYGRDNLALDYIFWVRFPKNQYHNSYDYFDAAPVISNNPVF